MDKDDLILELLKDLKKDMNRRFEEVDKRFEQIDKRFEQIDRRFEHMDKRFDRLEDDVRADKNKLQEVFEARKEVAVKFGWQWSFASLFIAIIAVGLSKIIFN